jgi:multidrug transporter EmrE-like cation transporter
MRLCIREDKLNSAIPLLILSTVAAGFSQVAFKKGMSISGGIQIQNNLVWISTLFKLLFTPYIIIGMVFYAVSTLLWLLALSKCPLNYAFPFSAITFILVFILSALLLHEPLPLIRIVGIGIIVCGIIVVGMK